MSRSAAAIAMPVTQGSIAWLDARRDLIGSSDIAVLTGNGLYGASRFDLWAVKTRLAEPAVPDEATQELFDLGHALEPVIAERYTLRTGRPVRRVNRMLRHPRYDFVGASLDRESAVRGDRRIVELKWAPNRRWFDTNEPIPAGVQDQVQWQLLVRGAGWVADVAVLNGSKVEHHTIEPDKGYQDDLLYIASDFWANFVAPKVRPEVDGSESTRLAIARMYPRDDGEILKGSDIPAELVELMARLQPAEEAEAIAKGEVGSIKNAIRLLLEGHAGAEANGWKVSYRRSKDGTKVNWEAIAGAYRRLLEATFSHDGTSEADALEALGFPLGADVLEVLPAIASLHSEVKPGHRTLLPKFKEEGGSWH